MPGARATARIPATVAGCPGHNDTDTDGVCGMSDEAQRLDDRYVYLLRRSEELRYRYLLNHRAWRDYELIYAVSGAWWDDPECEDGPGINGHPGKPLGEATYGCTGANLLENAIRGAIGDSSASLNDGPVPDGELQSLGEEDGRHMLDRGEALRFVLKHIDRINWIIDTADGLDAEDAKNGPRLARVARRRKLAKDRPLVIPEILKPLADERVTRPPADEQAERDERPGTKATKPGNLADLGAADWADIALVVPIEGEAGLTVRRKGARGLPRRVVWGDLGLGRCKKLQDVLRVLATRKGTCPRPGGREGEAFSQRVAKLRRTLRKAFGLASDPFEPPERDGMLRARFTIATPPDPDVTPARDVDDEIGDMFRAHVPERRF